MKKSIIYTLTTALLLVASAGLTSCSNIGRTIAGSIREKATYGAAIVSERSIEPISVIEVHTAMHVEVYKSDTARLVISSPSAERAERLVCDVQSAVLHLYERDLPKPLDVARDGIFLIKVYTPHLSSLSLSGAAVVDLKDVFDDEEEMIFSASGASELASSFGLQAPNILIKLSGASEITLDSVSTSQLRADLSGASLLHLGGSTEHFACDLSGASSLVSTSLVAQRVAANLSGASDAHIQAVSELSYDLSGASDLKCQGSPTVASAKSGGASSVRIRPL